MKKKTKVLVGIIIGLVVVIALAAVFYPRISSQATRGTIGSGVPKPPPVGTIGQSLTPLTPQGTAEFNNTAYQVTSISGNVNAHLPVKVEHISKANEIQVSRVLL